MAEQRERIGQIVGEYRLLHMLGGGSFSHVYLAEHIRDHHQVALKLLQIHLTTKEDLRAFLNEARTMRLRHPHIVPLLDFGLSHEDMPFLVMEYAARGTVRNLHPKGSRVPLPTVVTYATQIASALHYAHNTHVIHRDVKPENMLLRAEQSIQLSDFGIATTVHSTRSVMANVGGTVPYMAPEQLDGQPRPASDQYALGIVVYEWLAGYCPFRGTAVEVSMQHALKPPPSLVERVPGLPKEVEGVLFKALAKNPEERFASVQAFADALQQASHTATSAYTSAPPVPLEGPSIATIASEETIVPTLPSAASSSLPALIPSPTIQASSAQPAIPAAEMIPRRGAKPTVPLYQGTTPSEIIPTQVRAMPERKRSFSKGYIALLLAMVLVLIGGGSYACSAVSTFTAQAQATAIVRQATALAPTEQAAMDAYTARVAKDGIVFGFDAQHTHYNPYEQLLNGTNITCLRRAWVASTGYSLESSPAVASGLVYVGSDDHNLYAFDARTGQQKWVAPTRLSITSSPAIANGFVYVGSDDHLLYAFDALSGEQKWAAPTTMSIVSSPVVASGLVYVGSDDGKLYAFDAMTGQQKWVAETGDSIVSSPAVANDMIYVSSYDNKLYAFDTQTGKQKWVALVGGTIASSPSVANGLVYVGSNHSKLHAFDAMTGQQKWVISVSAPVKSSPAVANGSIYVGSMDGKLYAFDALTGQQQWVAATTAAISSSPTIANGLVYVGSEDGKLYVFDAAAGQQKWMAAAGDKITASPAVVNGFVYIGSHDNKLYAFSLFGARS